MKLVKGITLLLPIIAVGCVTGGEVDNSTITDDSGSMKMTKFSAPEITKFSVSSDASIDWVAAYANCASQAGVADPSIERVEYSGFETVDIDKEGLTDRQVASSFFCMDQVAPEY